MWQGIYPAGLVEEYSKSENKSLYEFSLDPEIMYFLSDRVGVKMKVVALRFDTIYKTQFLFSSKTNEVLWSVGLIIAIK